MKTFINQSWFWKTIIIMTLSMVCFVGIYLLASATIAKDHAAEKVAIEKVNLVCDDNGGIDDADEHSEFWEVRCRNEATFVVNKN